MGADMVRIHLAGYWTQRLPSGNTRHMVRVKGNARKSITIPVSPDDDRFMDCYHQARRGEKPVLAQPAGPQTKSFDWLAQKYIEFLEHKADSGSGSKLTLVQRRSLLTRAGQFEASDGKPLGTAHFEVPKSEFVALRNAMASTSAEADNMIKAIRSLYRFAIEIGHCSENPALSIARIHKPKGGAVAWNADDIAQYKKSHPPGTMAHLYLTLLMFTGCRIGDAIWLGRNQEVKREGQVWLKWQPRKTGSAIVEIPLLPPLFDATRAQVVQGPTYMLNEHGKPFKSSDTLRTRFARWCASAGLEGKSSHGIRKALAEILSEAGMSEKQVGSVLAHVNPSTTAIYTSGANRRRLAASSMEVMKGIKW